MVEKFEKLRIDNSFMFGEVFRNEVHCKRLLEIILGVKIKRIKYINKEKTYDNFYDAKGIRLDVYVDDGEGIVYDIDMQTNDTKELPFRSRYYQSMLDIDLLTKGEMYRNLKKSFIIFICKFDLFEDNRYMYTFQNRCSENTDILLNDNTYKIFLNTKGFKGNVSEELKNFLKYVENNVVCDEFTRNIDNEVKKLQNDKEVRLRYMTFQVYVDNEKYLSKLEGIEQGIKQGIEQGIEQAIEQGIEQGIQTGMKKGECLKVIIQIRKQLSKGTDIELIADFLDVDSSFVENIEKIIKEHPNIDNEDILNIICR